MAPGPENAAKLVPPQGEGPGVSDGAPGYPGSEGWEGKEGFPNIDYDVRGAAALYWARVTQDTILMAKPRKSGPDGPAIFEGTLVEVIGDSGPPVPLDGEQVPTVVVRAGARFGWIFRSRLERTEPAQEIAARAWTLLRASPGNSELPADCRPLLLEANLHVAPGAEWVVYSDDRLACRRALGVVARRASGDIDLLASASTQVLAEVRVARAAQPAMIVASVDWVREALDTGSNVTYYAVPEVTPAPLTVALDVPRMRIDARTVPVLQAAQRCLEGDLDHDGVWGVHCAVGQRQVFGAGVEKEQRSEKHYAISGGRFVDIAAPQGLALLDPLPPSRFEGGNTGGATGPKPGTGVLPSPASPQ
jgi:rhodanese-related sulfurtransferase